MAKEDRIMTIRKVNTLDEMFTRRQAQKSAGLEILQESSQFEEEYLYLETSGWHFYSYLKIRPHLIEDTSAYDDRRLMSISYGTELAKILTSAFIFRVFSIETLHIRGSSSSII